MVVLERQEERQQQQETEAPFRTWLQGWMQRHAFYQQRGDRYLIAEFVHEAHARGYPVNRVMIGRYLRKHQPVIPSADACRLLAHIMELQPIEVLLAAGHNKLADYPPVIQRQLMKLLETWTRHEKEMLLHVGH